MTDISSKRYNLDNFEASFREFLQNDARAGQAPPLQNNSIKNYLSDLRHFMGWFTFVIASGAKQSDDEIASSSTTSEGSLPAGRQARNDIVAMIDFEAVASYKRYLESNALPSKTINRRLSTLRKFCTFCIQQNWMKENPAKRVTNVGGMTHDGRDMPWHVSTKKSKDPVEIVRNDILSEFKQHLLSERDKQNVETRHGVSLQKNSDINLIIEDVQEFLSICHPA